MDKPAVVDVGGHMARIKQFVQPKYLYRYRPVRSRAELRQELSTLREGYIWTSPYTGQNDPTEGQYRVRASSASSSAEPQHLLQLMVEKSALGICSFSETHTNEIMWAHYGSGFSGLCVRYNVSRLLEALPEDDYLVRVFYDEKLISVGDLTDPQAAHRILSRKSYRWLYEREWRVLSRRRERLHLRAGLGVVTRVFTGLRFDPELEEELDATLGELGIERREMVIKNYAIRFEVPEPVDPHHARIRIDTSEMSGETKHALNKLIQREERNFQNLRIGSDEKEVDGPVADMHRLYKTLCNEEGIGEDRLTLDFKPE